MMLILLHPPLTKTQTSKLKMAKDETKYFVLGLKTLRTIFFPEEEPLETFLDTENVLWADIAKGQPWV